MEERKLLVYDELNREDQNAVDEILESMLKCHNCHDISGATLRDMGKGLDRVDKYMKILPGANYVLAQVLNYIFSNGLTTGSINQDENLNEFLYAKNLRSTTNKDELRNAIKMATSHGASGLRWYEGCIYQYGWGRYRTLTYTKDGINRTIGYVVRKDGKRVDPFKFDFKTYEEYSDFARDISSKGMIFLSPEDFMVLRNDTSLPYGSSPLLADKERLDLLVAVYDRLNYDIRYDGPGRIVIRPRKDIIGGDDDVSTSAVIQSALKGQMRDAEAIKSEAARIAREIKMSGSDAVIVLSNMFDEKIEHLERVTKATEFFTWIKNDTLILAQDFGMSPSLLEVGAVSGNVSMTTIIDTAMFNNIVSMRDFYSEQFSSFIAPKIGCDKIFFNKYEMKQSGDVDAMRTKYVNMLSLLNAMRLEVDGNTTIQPKAQQLFEDIADMLSANIHNENDKLEEI